MSGRYLYCGLELDSDVVLGGVPGGAGGKADVTIRLGAAPATLATADRRTAIFEYGGGEALWRFEGVARYLIAEGGRRITVAPAEGADPASVALFLLRPVFALAGVLRQDWLLDAAAVERDGQVTAIVGPSGSGKSTAAALLVRRKGFRLVADGMLRITLDAGRQPIAWPQSPGVILWPDARKRLDVADDDCIPLRPDLAPRSWPTPTIAGPLPLVRVAVLREQHGGDRDLLAPEPLRRQAFATLLQQLAGNAWIDALGTRAPLFRWSTAIAAAAPLDRLDLPWGWDQLDRLADRLEEWARARA